MTPLTWFLSIVLMTLCGVIVFLILGQDVKGGGLAGALGGGAVQSSFGGKTAETVLKFTAYLAAAFFVLVIVLIRVHSRESRGITGGPPTPTTTPPPVEAPADTPTPPPTTTP